MRSMSIDHLLKRRPVDFDIHDIDLFSAEDQELKELSSTLGLSLSLEEMWTIRSHFLRIGRIPSDVELQSVAQAWSEHCCYKSSRTILKENVFSIHHPDVLARGDAGVMAFDDEHAYALRIESHNHPSAIEPYGGAATGIGGILRDVVCMGAQPIALVDPLCFGKPDRDLDVPPGVKHPRYLLRGVVSGIRDYGNRVGVPTVAGGIYFDERYTGNCLVNVGCVGIARRDEITRNHVGGVGDRLILCGGRTGRDGIHGVTFASADLTAESEEESRGAVQLGDPIMKEPTIHACLDVNRMGLITGMKDLGGGGLSCVVGEMALDGGCGAVVHLDRVPLKEEGVVPWEVWVSESQERMMLAARKEDVPRILEMFDLWDVPATVIGEAVEGHHVKLIWGDEVVYHMDLNFVTAGPEYCRPFVIREPTTVECVEFPQLPALDDVMLSLLREPNIASKEWAIRQYDHEVRASTVIKPLQGRMNRQGPGDASVMKPVESSWRGLGIAVGCNPWYTAEDPYNGGMASVDEVCRNLVSVGARPHAITDCLNFGNPEKPDRLGDFRDAVRGIGEVCRRLSIPIPSGNVSFYNESAGGVALPTPVLLGTGIVEDVRHCVTSDLKAEGGALFLVGETRDEMGASALFRRFGGRGGKVPDVDVDMLEHSIDLMMDAMSAGMVAACHDCSDGGVAIALAEMCIGGSIGASIDLRPMGDLPMTVRLFSESNTRWVVEVAKGREADFEAAMDGLAVRIGTVSGDTLSVKDGFKLGLEAMREAWTSLATMLG